MKRSALCLAILCALSHPSAWAETKELWAHGVSKDSGWYDTTKVNPKGEDSQMCWAATASNMISWWQHWDTNNSTSAPQGALNIYDRLKKDYGPDLADNGAVLGLEWWFNGHCREYLSSQYILNKNTDVFKDTSFSGFYSSLGWNYDNNLKSEPSSLSYSSVYSSLVSSFEASQTVGLGIFSTSRLGHSITLWGIEYDSATQTISKLYVTDSDDYGTGLFALNCSEKDGLMYLSSDDHATYKTGNYHVDNLVTLGLISANSTASEDSLSGYASNSYVVKNGVITSVTTGNAPTVDEDGNVTYSSTADYSSSTYELKLHAGIDGVYKQINDVEFGRYTVSMRRVRLEAQGNVSASNAFLEVENSTLIGKSISLSNATEVVMTNAWIETKGTEKGVSTNTTFKGTGTIKNMKITGGSLISGNSPGLMTLENTVLENPEHVSTTLSFYLGAGNELSTLSDGHISIELDTTLKSGVVAGTQIEVSSGFLLTQGTTLSGDITLSVWNVGLSFNMYDDETTPRYFSEGSYIQVIAFGEGVSYRDVLGVNFILDSSISGSGDMTLMAVSDHTDGATWQKQVRTDGVYLVLSSAEVLDVPEPSTGVLVLTGLGLLLRRRRRARGFECAR